MPYADFGKKIEAFWKKENDMIRYVGFDMDGTLADTLDDVTNAVNFGLSQIGCPKRGRGDIQKFIGDSVYDLISRAMAPLSDSRLLEKAKQGFDLYYEQHYCSETRLYPGMERFIHELLSMDINLFIYSNKQIEFVKKMLQRLLPDVAFSGVLGNSKGFAPKPDPEQFLAFQKRESFEKLECLLIGYSDIDIKAAKNAGIYSVGVLWGYGERSRLLNAQADLYTEDCGEILKWIQKK